MSEPVFDVRIMNAFLESATHVLKTMCRTDPVPGKPSLKKSKILTGDASGIIALTSTSQHGVATLSFSKEAILPIVSKMLYEEKTWLDGDVKDAVGELTNMVAGDARRRLQGIGLKFEAGIPTVIIGKAHEIHTVVSPNAPTLAIPFKTENGAPFSVEFTFESNSQRMK